MDQPIKHPLNHFSKSSHQANTWLSNQIDQINQANSNEGNKKTKSINT